MDDNSMSVASSRANLYFVYVYGPWFLSTGANKMEEPTVISRVSPRILQRPTALYRIEQNNILVTPARKIIPIYLDKLASNKPKALR